MLDTLMQDSTSFHMSARVRPFSESELARKSYSIVNCNVPENLVELLEVRNDGTLKACDLPDPPNHGEMVGFQGGQFNSTTPTPKVPGPKMAIFDRK